jgi:hypothetical protein
LAQARILEGYSLAAILKLLRGRSAPKPGRPIPCAGVRIAVRPYFAPGLPNNLAPLSDSPHVALFTEIPTGARGSRS